MSRIIDYIKTYGNVNIKNLAFNHLDAAILTQLTLLDLSGVVTNENPITIKDAYKLYQKLEKDKERREGLLIYRRIVNIFRHLSEKERYCNLLLNDYVEIIEKDNPCQFSAVSIHLNNKILICFGGTDDTVIGWHEDFLLLYLEEIPSHIQGLKYLDNLMKKYDSDFILCGHSKGANIALNVVLYTSEEYNKRIKKVYCYDGPGINKKEFDNESLKDRISKITSYIPYRSSIGKLFEHYEKHEIVDCSANLLFQHDVSTWHVDYVDFVYKDEESSESIYLEQHIKKIISEMNEDDKKILVTSIFNILYISEIENFREITSNKKVILKNVLKLQKEEKRLLNKVFFDVMVKDAKIRRMLISILKEKRKVD